MKYAKIQNKGEIDINALLLLGASSKRGDSEMIGYFGSGLKYAISVLLKHKIDFKIFAGENEIKIKTVKKEFRGKEFDVIKINNNLTSLTTDMGPDWEPWFAVREIYCNAVDEKDYTIGVSDNPMGEKGLTTIFVSLEEGKLDDLFSNWNEYFSGKRADLIHDDNIGKTKYYSGSMNRLIVYRKGVRCHEEARNCLFHYDLDWIKINESRTINNTWDLSYYLPQNIAKGANLKIVRTIFDNYANSFEASLLWENAFSFNENWLKAIDGRDIIIDSVAGYFKEQIAGGNCLILPANLARALKDYFGTEVNLLGLSDKSDNGIELEPTERQLGYIQDAIDFLNKADIKISNKIVLWEFKNVNTLGEAKNDTIRLSPKLFELGKRMVVATLLEEISHLESGRADETRGFQDFIFNKLIVLLEEKVGERL